MDRKVPANEEQDVSEPLKSAGPFKPYEPPVPVRNQIGSELSNQVRFRDKNQPPKVLFVLSCLTVLFILFLYFVIPELCFLLTIVFVPAMIRFSILYYRGNLPTYTKQFESFVGSQIISVAIWLASMLAFVVTCSGSFIGTAAFIQISQPASDFFALMGILLTLILTATVGIYLFRLSLRVDDSK